jgi:exodeoxyribonuclease-1
MIAHSISIARSLSGICEYEAIQKIHALLNQPGTISLGYNTLGFDNDFLRFAFHRNLLPPYTHQYANDCGRMDLLPMVIIYWLYKSAVLQWPEIDGRVSLKLEHLKEANRLAEGIAHDALVDVQACLELAKRLAHEQTIWNYLGDYFNKSDDLSRITKLPPLSEALPDFYKFGLVVDVDFGYKNNFQVPVLCLGHSLRYSNQSLWLRLDLPNLRETTAETIGKTTRVIRKKYGEPGLLLPPYDRYLAKIDAERAQILEESKTWLVQNPELLEKISLYYREFVYPEVAEIDADAILYQMEFFSEAAAKLCRQFHSASWPEKMKLVDGFASPVARELARRILFRNYSQGLSENFKPALQDFMNKINPPSSKAALRDYKGNKRLTPGRALRQIKKLREDDTLMESQRNKLDELEAYFCTHFTIHEEEDDSENEGTESANSISEI